MLLFWRGARTSYFEAFLSKIVGCSKSSVAETWMEMVEVGERGEREWGFAGVMK